MYVDIGPSIWMNCINIIQNYNFSEIIRIIGND